jgi:predicted branched-subunit amino acid permease
MPTRDSPLRTSRSAVKEFLTGARDTVPLIVGAIPFGIIFGTVAVAEASPCLKPSAMSFSCSPDRPNSWPLA